ncbi:MAG: SDR family oxidoreductase [Gammaproteobacteria bacterium]|jgi:3-oxoacyl-[acyl-carrier protein] reductase|nr:SDR family oxidoreductase [Gammaproteobacteria bacterium]
MGKQRLIDKVAIVTGAGQGIGEGIASVFAEEGAKVVVATRTEKNGSEMVEKIKQAGGEALLVVVDVGDENSARDIVEATIAAYGRVDIMVHNAASFLMGAIEDYTEEDMETAFSVNLKACFRLTAACIPHFKKQKSGRILITSSVTGPRVAYQGLSYYAASKSGVNGFIRNAALELARDGITVNGIEPGYIRTAAMELLTDEEGIKKMEYYIPAGHLGDPKDIAYAMLFLATEEARYITGQTIVVDGGSTLPESPTCMDELNTK